MSSNGRNPLFKKRSAPPPSATTSMLESLLDEKKTKTRSKKPKRRRVLQNPPPPCLEEVSNATTLEKIVFPTQGLEAVPNFVSKKKSKSVPKYRKPIEIMAPRQRLGNALAPTRKPSKSTFPLRNATQKTQFPLALSIGRGKKRSRDRSTSFIGSFDNGATLNDVTVSVPVINNVKPSDEEALMKDKTSFHLDMKQKTEREAIIQDEKPKSLEMSTKGKNVAPELSSKETFQASDSGMRKSRNNAPDIPMKSTNTKVTKRAVEPSKQKVNNDNFVRLNMKNSAGACRGARNKSTRFKRFDKNEKRTAKKKKMLQSGVDPLDDFVDGVYKAKGESSNNDKAPSCARHQRPCKLLVVKKNNTGNKGRKFYVCSLPRGEQCDHFEWADNTVEAAKRALARNTSFSGFVARQVAAYTERFETLTVPELRDEAKRRGLMHTGKRKQLLMRLSLWVRDEVVKTGNGEFEAEIVVEEKGDLQQTANENDSDSDPDGDDDCSVSSEELELCDAIVPNGEISTLNSSSMEENGCNDDDDGDEEGYDERCDLYESLMDRKTPPNDPTKPSTLQDQLQELFGHEKFRDGQEWTVTRCLEKKRTLLVAPTGFGKSLCYALPAALMDGLCVVVSPLISLMQDQLRQLPPRVPAATLSGSLTAAAMAATIDDVIRNRLKILFVSPERLASPSFRRLFQTRWNQETKIRERSFPTVSLLCVDEAHCVSQWGHNFRPSYLRLKSLLDLMQPESVLAMTATAGPLVINDICDVLNIPQCAKADGRSLERQNQPIENKTDCSDDHGVKRLVYDRDNIDVCCKVLSSEDERLSQLKKLLGNSNASKRKDDSKSCLEEGCLAQGSVIVYVWRQRDTEVVAENLMASGIEGGVVLYHGGMDSNARAKAQSKFMRGKARICVATVAFGMGVNKADVVGVVHMYLPSSPESYLQETGRAGRDGRPARAIALILSDEVVVKHSLAHSDMLSTSQIKTLLEILRNQVLETLAEIAKDIGQDVDIVARYGASLHIALPIESTIMATDCKIETVETLLSLLEGADRENPFLKIQATMTDQATITMKRKSLEKLAKTEKLADCIMKCGSCLDSPEAVVKREDDDPHTREKQFLAYSFGSHNFSVTKCACLLGSSAEPRHVFAALRRLQNSGDLELSLDGSPTGRALYLKVEPSGVEHLAGNVSSLDEMACQLAGRFSTNVAASAKKALDAHRILKRVASVDQSKSSEGNTSKSPSLALFQDLVESYFGGDELKDFVSDTEDELPRLASKGIRNELRVDVSSLLRDMKGFPNFQKSIQSGGLDALDPKSRDYTALAMTKFMHSLDTPRSPYKAFSSHPLYGKWRDVDFSSLMREVERILNPSYHETA